MLQTQVLNWSTDSLNYGTGIDTIQINAGDGDDIITVENQANAAVTVIGGVGAADSLTIDAKGSGAALGGSSVAITGGQTVSYDSTTETVSLENSSVLLLDDEAVDQIQDVLRALKDFAASLDGFGSWGTPLPLTEYGLSELTEPGAVFTNLYDDFVAARGGPTMR